MHTSTTLIARLNCQVKQMPYLLLSLAMLFWAGNIVLAKGIIEAIPPISLAFWRWLIASFILLPFSWSYLKKDWRLARQYWPILTMLSITGVSCYNTFLYIAVQTSSANNSALITAAIPAVIILLSLILLNITITKLQVMGLVLSFIGVSLVITHGSWKTILNMTFVKGDLWLIAGIISSALYAVLLHHRPQIHAMSLIALTFILGMFLLIPVYLWELTYSPPLVPTAEVIASIIIVAIFPSILAYLCWNRGVELIGANRAGLFINFIPIYVAITAYIFLGEILFWFHYAGMLLILGGVVLFNWKKQATNK